MSERNMYIIHSFYPLQRGGPLIPVNALEQRTIVSLGKVSWQLRQRRLAIVNLCLARHELLPCVERKHQSESVLANLGGGWLRASCGINVGLRLQMRC
jgi:hypothetical protein